jgi:hypothetical protein
MSYTSAGVPNWGMAFGGVTSGDDVKALVLDNTNAKVFVAAQFNGTPNFDPLSALPAAATSVNSDIFIGRYNFLDGHLSLTGGTLPVTWTKIDITKNGDKVLLSWETACETNNKGFTIERSNDGSNFQYAGYMASTATGDCGKASYHFEDRVNGMEGKIYYRLKQTDIDGKSSYSKILMVSNDEEKANVAAYPNPAKNNFTISRYGNNAPDKAVIYNSAGKLMARLSLSSYNNVDCGNYAPGVYYINYYNCSKLAKSEKLVISR